MQTIGILIREIVNVAETGTKKGVYGKVDIYPDGEGNSRQITFGRSCTTEQGNLKHLIKRYIDNNGIYSEKFKTYYPLIGVVSLVDDLGFQELLVNSGTCPIMKLTQDIFFDDFYYHPAMKWCKTNNLILPLTKLIVYDSFVHSGGMLTFLRNRFPETPDKGEKKYITSYINVRHKWLSNHSRSILRKTTYRTKFYLDQIANDNWDLKKRCVMNGIVFNN